MKRGPLASARGREHFIYVDEAGLVPGHLLAALLSEIRKYGIGIVLGSQYTKQLTSAVANTRKDTLLDSVHGNVGTMVVFRLGKEDAREMSALFWPSCGILDIVRLPNFCGYCKMSAGSQSLPPFSFQSRPLDSAGRHDQADEIRERSRQRYGVSATLVDDLLVQHRKAHKSSG
ncbi:MAG: type IV secretion system DNA-binding domain-containing protein [Desulfobacterales bacterium]|nr:type IV secretion system DNA-binding domain-containing protein [Desulfobacterales bacterium]